VGLIGEIRDEDTARTILRAALTGHLVFGSLHTKSCPTSIVRLIDLGAERNMLAESLLLVECQRLIRRLCPQCRRQSELPSAHRTLFERHNLPVPPLVYARGEHAERCEACRGRGYRGRIAAAEVLPNVPEVRGLIESAATSQAYLAWMRAHHLPTVFENALELVATGATSVEEALTLQDAWEGDEWHQLY
jgi:type IV pilus assembly protein PilB